MSESSDQKPSDWLPSNAAKPVDRVPRNGRFLGYGMGEWVAAGVLGCFMLFLLFGYVACSGSSGESERHRSTEQAAAPSGTTNVTGAWAYMQQFVKKRLKSPSTADFPFGGHRDVKPLGDDRYLVESYVDSQNSFGARVRTNFRGVIKQTQGGWKLEELVLEE